MEDVMIGLVGGCVIGIYIFVMVIAARLGDIRDELRKANRRNP